MHLLLFLRQDDHYISETQQSQKCTLLGRGGGCPVCWGQGMRNKWLEVERDSEKVSGLSSLSSLGT